MRTLRYSINVTLDGCCDHRVGVPDAQMQRRELEMVEVFKNAGVPAAQIVYLRDKQATQEGIDSAFAGEMKRRIRLRRNS